MRRLPIPAFTQERATRLFGQIADNEGLRDHHWHVVRLCGFHAEPGQRQRWVGARRDDDASQEG